MVSAFLGSHGVRAVVPERCRSDEAEVWRSLLWLRTTAPRPSGVALLIHGLNQTPSATNPLAVELNNIGIDVLRLTLQGHGGQAEFRAAAFLAVDADSWLHQALCAYEELRAEADAREVPAFLVAFSLGGLVGAELVSSGPGHVAFDRMVLLAPAIRTRWYVRGARLLRFWPGLVVPSAAPPAERANPGTPIAAYEALFALEERMRSPSARRLNVPTLVLVDEEDEVVSAEAMREMLTEYGLHRWTGASIRKAEDATGKRHHGVTAPEHVGRATWTAMMARIRVHLLDD
jgi:alpha-beta hydrolase superfamily lysophospholipase